MYKVLKEIKELVSKVDIFIEVFDVCILYFSENLEIVKIWGDILCLKIFNKFDLVDLDFIV